MPDLGEDDSGSSHRESVQTPDEERMAAMVSMQHSVVALKNSISTYQNQIELE